MPQHKFPAWLQTHSTNSAAHSMSRSTYRYRYAQTRVDLSDKDDAAGSRRRTHAWILYFIKSGISRPSSGAHAYSQLRARMHESCMHILDPFRSDHALYARTSTARTMHVWAAPYKMYEAPYILPYMTGNLRPTAQSHQPTVCINLRPQYKSIVYFSLQWRY